MTLLVNRTRRWFALALLLLMVTAAQAAESINASDKATTSRKARNEAIDEIPWERLSQKDRSRVAYVINKVSVYRRLPTKTIDCDPHIFMFLLKHPEVITNIWKALGVSEITVTQTAPGTYHGSDGETTSGNVKVVHEGFDRRVFYAEGAYRGAPFSKPVRARSVLLLRWKTMRETNGRHYITCRLDTFIHLESVGVDILARTFHPLFGKAADYNFVETVAFVSSLSRTAEINPAGTEKIARRLKDVDPEVRDQLVLLSQQLSARRSKVEAQRVQHQKIARRNRASGASVPR